MLAILLPAPTPFRRDDVFVMAVSPIGRLAISSQGRVPARTRSLLMGVIGGHPTWWLLLCRDPDREGRVDRRSGDLRAKLS